MITLRASLLRFPGRVALPGLLCLSAACAGGGAVDREGGGDTPRIVLLAADGLEWDVLLPLVREGRVPELRRLMEEGSCGLLETFEPTLSPAIWTSIATGKDVETHGIKGFRYDDPDDPSAKKLYTNADRRTKAFWNILSDYGRRVNLVGWFLTFPVEPVNGLMVAQTNTLGAEDFVFRKGVKKGSLLPGVEGQVYPPERGEEIMEILVGVDRDLSSRLEGIFGSFPHALGEFEAAVWKKSQWALRADATYVAIGRHLAAEPEAADLMALYLGGADVLAHRFWRYREPEAFENPPDAAQVENLGRVVTDYYVYIDGVLGELRARYATTPTVIVVSDHGMHAVNESHVFARGGKRQRRISGGHGDAPDGLLIAAGPAIRRTPLPAAPEAVDREDLDTVGTVYDVAPTLLALLGVPVGEDMRGRVMVDIIEPEHLDRHPVRAVATHDTEEWLASRPEAPEMASDERLEQLRGLGYIP